MKKLVPVLLLLVFTNTVVAQFTLRLVVNDVATRQQDDIFVAGSFNNWNPADTQYKLKPYGTSRRAIILKDLPPGRYEFKFTRGNFNKVETTANGEDIPNREADVKEDVTITTSIAGWKDDFPDKIKPNTASPQVMVVDTAFAMPQLKRTRRIWAYLPKGYQSSRKKYPVIYMHDGQNLFSEHTASFGEWGVDESLDTLMTALGKESIVIGIDNGGDKRMTEYNPYDHKQFGKGEGDAYVDFIVHTLKPFIDKTFRTRTDSANTFIAGSSMGGLISMYAVTRYPNVFSGAGIFSPAFWVAPQIYDDVAQAQWGRSFKRFYFYAGGKEGELMVPDMDKMVRLIESKGNYETLRIMNPLGKHNEAAWRKEFPHFYHFIIRK